jgi:Spy/CpxP family protein refolding chaperone
MSNKKYLGVAAATLLAVGVWSFPGRPQEMHGQEMHGLSGPGRMIGHGHGMMLPLLLRGVNLTADQKAQIQQIMGNHRATFRDLFGQMHATHEEMHKKLFEPGALQESDLMSQSQQISQLHDQLKQEGLKVILEIRGVLTPDQLARAAKLRQQMQALRTQMRNLLEQAR